MQSLRHVRCEMRLVAPRDPPMGADRWGLRRSFVLRGTVGSAFLAPRTSQEPRQWQVQQ
jgi:hypothetical protein